MNDNKKFKRDYFSCVLVDFRFRGIPSKSGQHYLFGGRADVIFKAYSLNSEEIEKIDEELKGCPNWILIAIPKLVVNEIERKAIRKYRFGKFPERAGWPNYDGRIGQRALQEILDLDTNINHRGVSIMTVGQMPSNFNSFKDDPIRWDSEIRSQFRDFISRISFHKGAFFVTQDRVNAMMARAEGLQSLFLQKPEYDDLIKKHLTNTDVARVLYEIAVSFGEIKVEGLGKFSVFWPGKHVDDWERSRVMITELY